MTRTDSIRPVTREELPLLRELERASGEVFRQLGMVEIADEEPLALSDLEHYEAAGRAWVLSDATGLAGFLLAEPVDVYLHIAQVSVHPRVARQGLGRVLIEHLAGIGATAGVHGLSLTTYADVPWNAPYYRRLGFVELRERDWGPGLRVIREAEKNAGLDRWPRVAMVRPLR
ncbi:MAG TPA: GNAT family N-acetyltransferase [Pseudonocardia sp.]|jgi:GNAT superfamily N-acetyltransferase|nr:GNAT family N-acetyltransferase [Pseudonocardia sp.]